MATAQAGRKLLFADMTVRRTFFVQGGMVAMRLTLCEALTSERRSDHNTENYVPYCFQ